MALTGKWTYVSAEGLEQYMVATGVPEELRKVALASEPSMEVSNDGDSWTIKTTVSDKVKDTTFKVGEEFQSQSLAGQALTCKVTVEGTSKMTEIQKAEGVEVTITREVTGDELVSVMKVKDASATVKFKRA